MSGLEELCRRREACEITGLCGGILVARYLSWIGDLLEGTLGAFREEWRREVDWTAPATLKAFRELAWRARNDLYFAVRLVEPVAELASSHQDLLRFLQSCRGLRDEFDQAVFQPLTKQGVLAVRETRIPVRRKVEEIHEAAKAIPGKVGGWVGPARAQIGQLREALNEEPAGE